jgi:hypothetical protein
VCAVPRWSPCAVAASCGRLREAVAAPVSVFPLSARLFGFHLCFGQHHIEHVINDLLAGFGELCELIELLGQLRWRATLFVGGYFSVPEKPKTVMLQATVNF